MHTIKNYKPGRFIDYISKDYRQNIIDFQNLAFDTSRELSMLIDGRNSYAYMLVKSTFKNFAEIGNAVDEYIQQLTNSKEFLVLKEKAGESLKVVESEWNKNSKRVEEYLESIKIFIDSEYRVFITHPGIKCGSYLGDNTILWTNQTYFKNYNTVYLTHEILHSYFKSSDPLHALIELIADNHLRSLLNNDIYPPLIGHRHLEDYRKKVYPIWKSYVSSQNKEIKELINYVSKV